MKRRLFLILLALTTTIMVGCINPPDYQRVDKWQILELDSCEYIQADKYVGYVHKGNCRFCKECRQFAIKLKINDLLEHL